MSTFIQWVQDHYVTVFAIVGEIYVVARLVVALTPTPKDDKALDKVGFWLKQIASLFGLDLKQGINKG
ncbi:MAG: hypothetical protein ACTSUP_08130 [Candidatus Heimdallarchaeaceae archaeon]